VVIPAHPLALTASRNLDERRQRALTRYYLDAGAGGIAVGVHTTQFAIRESKFGLYRPVLELAAEETKEKPVIRIAGVCGLTPQAVKEAETARGLGYDVALLSMAALREATIGELIEHARTISQVIPVMGFYLQPAVGGRPLPYEFWRRFAEIENVVAIKIAPFDRYATLDVVRGVADSGRADEVALYTGNDDHIVLDLLTPYRFGERVLRMRGGLLGHWAFWTEQAVKLQQRARCAVEKREDLFALIALANQITDVNAAVFDVANNFHGCIAGIHEVLRRQGLLEDLWCLDPEEGLSPGQKEEIDRVIATYPHLNDDWFVKENLDRWLA
jgi:dihydrodipicolinate synthase/N-acetylneuraminate lyase